MASTSGVRQRRPIPPDDHHNIQQEQEREQQEQPPPAQYHTNGVTNTDMAYGRRNFIAYQRSGANPNATLFPTTRSLTSYRNKIILILVVTALYTAFLYQRG